MTRDYYFFIVYFYQNLIHLSSISFKPDKSHTNEIGRFSKKIYWNTVTEFKIHNILNKCLTMLLLSSQSALSGIHWLSPYQKSRFKIYFEFSYNKYFGEIKKIYTVFNIVLRYRET
jgi:hypothetical protein